MMVSHTTTGEWQSFEMRMRRRRAERLALRAQAAVDAGCFEDARTCLVEARALVPTLPQLDGIERQLPSVPLTDDRSRIEPEGVMEGSTLQLGGAGSSSRPRLAMAAVAAIATAVALAVWMFLPRGELVPPGTAAAQPSVQQAPAAAPRASDPMPVPSAVFDEETLAAATASVPTASVPTDPPTQLPAPEPAAPQPEPRRQELPAAVESTTAALPPTRPPEPQPRPEAVPVRTESTPSPASEPTVSLPAVPAPPPVGVLDLPAAGSAPTPPVSAPTPPVSAPPPPEPSQEPAVRSVLNRYASAYSALDADAAQRVWPGVNRGALARAFDSLASQQISLGSCRVEVAGARATAMCAGSATWSPKIGGGGTQSEARNWTFELARAGGGWEIVSARVQNR